MSQWKSFAMVIAMALFMPLVIAAQSPAGTWTTIDDKTGKKRALIRLSVLEGTLNGTIVNVYSQPGDTSVCKSCPGSFKNQPILGLRFLWGLKDKGNGVWDDGQILDPKSGKIYRAKVTVQGNKLYVRGYIGLSALGRTQVWVR